MSLVTSEQLLTIQQRSGIRIFTLAFIVDNGNCQASWGGLGQTIPNDALPNGTTISSLVQGVRQAGGDVIVSFGGAIGTDLSSACSSASQVQAMYQSVIDRYQVKMLDFDIEGFAASSPPAVDLRNQAVKGLKAANPGLIVSYTLPVLPTGLVDAGLNILDRAKSSGLDLDVVNVMAMDYGSANDNRGQMGLSAVSAATATEAQILNAGLSSSVGVTPMIGVNDTNTEIFGLADAQMLVGFAQTHSYVSRLAIWSVSRDNGSCAGQTWASPLCSGITQDDYAFSRIFESF
jgi:chitinase